MAELEQFVVLAGAEEQPLTKLADYKEAGGYESLAKARKMEPAQVVQEILDSGLRGRGGAFFPTGRKASFLAKDTGKPTYLVVNADESEPGTFKDREIMFTVPHRLIEGCLITAHAIACERVFIYIRGEYLTEFEIIRDALEEVRADGLLGGVTIVLHRGAGAYICGEETGAARVARGQARPAAHEAAVPGDRGPLRVAEPDQQRRDDRDRAEDHRARREALREDRRPAGLVGHARLLALRQRRQRRQLRAADGRHAAPADLRRRRRHPGRARAEGGDPGRLVRAGADGRTRSTSRSTRPRWPRPGRCSAPARSS